MPPLRHRLRASRLNRHYLFAPTENNLLMNIAMAPPRAEDEILVEPILPLPPPPEPELPETEDPFITLAQDTLPHQLDCIAWNHKHDFFVFGSYELDPANSEVRHGILYLAKLTPDIGTGYTLQQQITGLPGILDLKWEPTEEKLLAAATSNRVILYQLEIIDGNPVLSETHSGICGESNTLALYVQWLNRTDLVSSDSAGFLRTWTTKQENREEAEINQLTQLKSTCVHLSYVWFVHYDPISEVFYSGDDNGTLATFHASNFEMSSLHVKKKFDTGVTAINTRDDLVTVGCYDEKLRVFKITIDESNLKITISDVLLEMDLRGTVWRTIWIPPFATLDAEDDPSVLKMGVAAGTNGIHMISFNRSTWTWETTLCCLDHRGDLAYGIDMKVNEADRTYTVATCYFDSHVLQIFKMKP